MLSESISYPSRGDGWVKRIGIGGLCLLFSWLIFPAILVYGYQLRVFRSAALGEETAPPFDALGELLVDGIKMYAVGFVHGIVPVGMLLIGVFLSSGTDSGVSILGALFLLVGGLLTLVVSYIVPVALTNFALNDSLGAAFDFETIAGAAFTGRYFLAVVLAWVVGGILGFIAGILSLLLVGLFLLFYINVMISYLIGRGCGPALLDDEAATGQQSHIAANV